MVVHPHTQLAHVLCSCVRAALRASAAGLALACCRPAARLRRAIRLHAVCTAAARLQLEQQQQQLCTRPKLTCLLTALHTSPRRNFGGRKELEMACESVQCAPPTTIVHGGRLAPATWRGGNEGAVRRLRRVGGAGGAFVCGLAITLTCSVEILETNDIERLRV